MLLVFSTHVCLEGGPVPMTGQDRPGGAILAGPAVPGVAGPGCWAVLPQVLPQCLDYFLIPSQLVEDPVYRPGRGPVHVLVPGPALGPVLGAVLVLSLNSDASSIRFQRVNFNRTWRIKLFKIDTHIFRVLSPI